jgi:hypothetical protein
MHGLYGYFSECLADVAVDALIDETTCRPSPLSTVAAAARTAICTWA